MAKQVTRRARARKPVPAADQSSDNVRVFGGDSVRPTPAQAADELIKLRAGLARDKASRAQSIIQVVIAATCLDPQLRTGIEEPQFRDALFAASDLLSETCDQLDEVNIAKAPSVQEREHLDQGMRS